MTSADHAEPVVVVGVDGSAASVAALNWAARYQAAAGGTIRVVLVWHVPAAAGSAPGGVGRSQPSDEVLANLRQTLDKAVGEVFGNTVAENVQAGIEYGHPAQLLVDLSRHADLLVVGYRGHGAFRGMLIGSVSIHCVTHAHCPVVVVRES